jgi:hypothetical protein
VGLEKSLVSIEVGLGIVRRCLSTNQIRFGLTQAGLRHVLLRFGLSQLALSRSQIGYRASERDFVIARVQFDQKIALFDLVIIVKVNGLDMGRKFWAYLDHVPFNGRIIGRFIANVVDVPESAAGQQERTEAEKNNEAAT